MLKRKKITPTRKAALAAASERYNPNPVATLSMTSQDLRLRALDQRRTGHLRVPAQLLGLAPSVAVLVQPELGQMVGPKGNVVPATRRERRTSTRAARALLRGQHRAEVREAGAVL